MNEIRFPTSDEDSSTPDMPQPDGSPAPIIGFRPLTRIHLLLTGANLRQQTS